MSSYGESLCQDELNDWVVIGGNNYVSQLHAQTGDIQWSVPITSKESIIPYKI